MRLEKQHVYRIGYRRGSENIALGGMQRVHGSGSVYRVRGRGRFLYGIMHVEDAPPTFGILSAHGHPMSGAVFLGSINPEIVGVPQDVAEGAYVTRPHFIAQFGSKLEVTLAQITHDLLASPVLTMLSIENNFRIKALLHRFHVSLIEGDIAGPHVPFHLGKCVCGISRLTGWRRYGNSPLQIDGHPHLIEQIHTQAPIDLPSTGLADWTQVNRWELQIAQLVRAQLYLRQENFAGAGGCASAPRINVDLLGLTRCKRLQIEDRGGCRIEQEPPVFSRNLHGDNRQAIATFDRNFVLLIVGLGAD